MNDMVAVECPLCASRRNEVPVVRVGRGDYEGFVRCLGCGCELHGAEHGRTVEEARFNAKVLWNDRKLPECVYTPVRAETGRVIGQVCSECGYQSTVEAGRDAFEFCPGCRSLIVGRYKVETEEG